MNERDRKKHTATSRLDTSSLPRGPLNWVFFPAALLYHELLLRAFDRQSTFFTGTLVLVVLFALGAGLFWSLLINLFRHRRAATIVSIAATALWTVLVCVEYCCRSYFKSYFALSFIGNMASDVVGGFGDTVLPNVVLPRLPFILLAFVPLALCILLRRRSSPSSAWAAGPCCSCWSYACCSAASAAVWPAGAPITMPIPTTSPPTPA